MVLAGGRSSRFGRDKAWHRVDGEPMLIRILNAMRHVTDDVAMSVSSDEDEGPEGVRRIVDKFPGEGPIAGLHAALADCRTEWILVAPCDVPYLSPHDLQALLDGRTPAVAAVVAADSTGRLHPLCACYHRYTIAEVERMLTSDERAVHRLLERLNVVSVLLPDRSLRNINSIADL